MRPITVSIDLAAPIARVWARLADLEHQDTWMKDIESMSFQGPRRQGEGTVMKVATKVGPLRLLDQIVVTSWEPPVRMTVKHRGLVKGTGEFTLSPIAGATRLSWTEELVFPWKLGGAVTALASRPILATIWRANLRRFQALVE